MEGGKGGVYLVVGSGGVWAGVEGAGLAPVNQSSEFSFVVYLSRL